MSNPTGPGEPVAPAVSREPQQPAKPNQPAELPGAAVASPTTTTAAAPAVKMAVASLIPMLSRWLNRDGASATEVAERSLFLAAIIKELIAAKQAQERAQEKLTAEKVAIECLVAEKDAAIASKDAEIESLRVKCAGLEERCDDFEHNNQDLRALVEYYERFKDVPHS